jgi:hypothetical protein
MLLNFTKFTSEGRIVARFALSGRRPRIGFDPVGGDRAEPAFAAAMANASV